MTRTELTNMFTNFMNDVRSEANAAANSNNAGLAAATQGTTNVNGVFATSAEGYGVWSHSGFLERYVPLTYELPKAKIKHCCDWFLRGIPVEMIRPFRLIPGAHFSKKSRQYFSRAKFVFESIVSVGINDLHFAQSIEDLPNLSSVTWNQLVDQAIQRIMNEYSTISRGFNGDAAQFNYTTFYDILKKINRSNNVVEEQVN